MGGGWESVGVGGSEAPCLGIMSECWHRDLETALSVCMLFSVLCYDRTYDVYGVLMFIGV